MENEFIQLVINSDRILITSHISPDPDALASVLLMGSTLMENFPNKSIALVLEEEPDGLDFMQGYNHIQFKPLSNATESFRPQLMIIVDANNYSRCTRSGADQLEELIKNDQIKSVIVDHHEPDGKSSTDVYINNKSPAAAQEVYELLFDRLRLKKPENFAQVAMAGIYSDTGGFAYSNPRYRETFRIVTELVEAGANIEDIKNSLSQFSLDQMKVIAELMNNIASGEDYTYTYITDEFMTNWLGQNKPLAKLRSATKRFIDDYIRNIDGRRWGFLIYPDPLEGENGYSVSLRAVGEIKDVAAIARILGGGGHKPAAGCKVQANSIHEAVDIVRQAVTKA